MAENIEIIARFTPSVVSAKSVIHEYGLKFLKSKRYVLVARHQALWWEQYQLRPDGLLAAGEDGFPIPIAPKILTVDEGLESVQSVTWKELTFNNTASPYRVPPRHRWDGSGRDLNRFYDRDYALCYLADTARHNLSTSITIFLDAGWWLSPEFDAIVLKEKARKEKASQEREAAYAKKMEEEAIEKKEKKEAAALAQSFARGLKFMTSTSEAPHPWQNRSTVVTERLTCGVWSVCYNRDHNDRPIYPVIEICIDGKYWSLTRHNTIRDAKCWIALLLRSSVPWEDYMNHTSWSDDMNELCSRWAKAMKIDDFRMVPELDGKEAA